VELRGVVIGIVLSGAIAVAQTQEPVPSTGHQVPSKSSNTSTQVVVPVAQSSAAKLQAERPRLVPDPAALEAEVGAVDIAQLARMVNEQSSVVNGQVPENQHKGSLDSGAGAPALGMTNQNPNQNSAAWKQDPAAQGGNFTPDLEALKSAQELDEKVGREQAVNQGTGDRGKGPDKPKEQKQDQKQKQKYDVEKIGERGVGGGMNFFSIDREIKMGAEMAKEIDAQVKFFTDERVNEYVNRLAQNLARNSDVRVPMQVRIIDSDELNAFALPGGRLYVNVGMIMAAENEAELAGVMAHEIAHVAARHATKNATKRQIWNLASIPLMFVGGPAGMVVNNLAQIAVPMTFFKFSRNAEREADLLGLEYEYAAGYDPAAMVNFFEKLQTKDKKKPNFVVRAFQTHPMNDDRLKRAQKTIAEMLPAKDEYLVSSSEFDEIKARLGELTANKLRIGIKDEAKPRLKAAGKWR
jgi:Zn-dependent protease with chaperone function